ncbi:hypothetical protein [Pseudothermotoga sp.]|uniref:hypothetical protein n=1 Tax=Pseudothermotoga sp. TaxID=2033661 RepID=UPI0031F6DAE0
MKRFLIFVSLFTFVLAFAWSAHETLTYLIVKSTLPKADSLVQITPYTYVEKRIYNTEKLILDDVCGKFISTFVPAWAKFYPPDPTPIDGGVPIWQILTVYSTEPDLGMDEGLNLSKLQSIIGNSQGVRHMKYKLLFFDFFEGSESFLYFVEMSKKAFEKKDRYWGYRFLARAIHHLEDLSMPYHNAPGRLGDVLESLLWNRKKAEELAYRHFSYDEFLAYLLYLEDRETLKVITESEPKQTKNLRELVQRVRLLGLRNLYKVDDIFEKVYSNLDRTLSWNDFVAREGELKELKKITIEIIGEFSGLLKGFLLDFLHQVGEI